MAMFNMVFVGVVHGLWGSTLGVGYIQNLGKNSPILALSGPIRSTITIADKR